MEIEQILRDKLTPAQFEAAMDPAPEVLCLACAGSGKSRTLAYRIARLLAQGVKPEEIVAFTFTEKAAESIKRRVAQALSAAGFDPTVMGAMYIGTIHAYCQHVLGELDATFRQFDVLDENRLKLYLMSRFWKLGLKNFRPRCRGEKYFETITQVSNAWKTVNDELLDIITVTTQDQELGELLTSLRDSLKTDQYIDFSLMIRALVDSVRANAPGVENAIGQVRHLMVDEYQDVNPCQEELIRLLHARSGTLFVVGDDDQSIYAWRGADVGNILGFQDRYPACSAHTLAQNFRSTEPIVQASDRFIAAMLGASRITKNPVAASNKAPQDLRVLWFPDRPTEAEWVAAKIQELLGTKYEDGRETRGLTPADFAILMRSTREPEQDGKPRHAAFTDALERAGISFSLEAGGGPFDCPQIAVLRDSFALLRDASPVREVVQHFFDSAVKPAYLHADFNALVKILSKWGRDIHRPEEAPRDRLYPQELVHELLEAFNIAKSNFSDEIMRNIGLFSQMILDVETVYMSVDSKHRFTEVLNFLNNIAEHGYDVSTDDVIQRPDTVTVSTVHKMKGLEFPCVFVVDVEAQRFPKRKSEYSGLLPGAVIKPATDRGAYKSTQDEEIRLFYTAATRAERYLYITGAKQLPAGAKERKISSFAAKLGEHPSVEKSPEESPFGIEAAPPKRRIEESDYPTSFTEIKYYLQCPKGYQFRTRYGFNPAVPALFGYGRSVHTLIQKLHELNPDVRPDVADVPQVVDDTFHLKHVPPSKDPVNRPGAYENSKNKAVEIAQNYVKSFGADFERGRQVEAVFEIPAAQCVITGSIDLLLQNDTEGNILQAEVIDFKTMEGGKTPEDNPKLDWTELALQVQLYARAADKILGQNAKTGSVHLLKDNQRVEVPITQAAVDAALTNIEWAVAGILASDFPMRPHPEKCESCDFNRLCAKTAQDFRAGAGVPPEIHLSNGSKELARAFSLFQR